MNKTELREQRLLQQLRPRVKRVASILDFSQTLRPASLLMLMTIIPLITLMLTYSISANIIIDHQRNLTVFQTKSELICWGVASTDHGWETL